MASQDYANPSQGKLLGYVYRNPGTPDRVIDNVAIKQGPNETDYALPGTKADYVSDGVGYALVNRGSDNERALPIAPAGMFESVSTTPLPGANRIPIYEPPINLSYEGKSLSDQDKYQLGASLAGAQDAKPPKAVRVPGALDSNYLSNELRTSLGLPKSFDMLSNVDPTASDWGLSKSSVWNPKSGGFGGDLLDALSGPVGKVAGIAGMILGAPGIDTLLGGSTSGAAGEAVTGDILSNLAAQQASQQAIQSAITGALSGSAAPIFSEAVVNKALDQALQGALTSGAISGGTAALTGGDPLKAALKGAVTGGVSGGLSGVTAPLVQQLGLPVPVGSALTGAITGGGTAAITGGDVMRGALSGGITSGVGSLIQQIPGMESLPPNVRNAIASALAGAAGAAVTKGGNPLLSGILGGLSGLATQTPKTSGPQNQPVQQVSSQGNMTDLLSLIALSQPQQAQPAPQPVQTVGQITPYEFSNDLLEGIYQSKVPSTYGANEELLRLTRGQR